MANPVVIVGEPTTPYVKVGDGSTDAQASQNRTNAAGQRAVGPQAGPELSAAIAQLRVAEVMGVTSPEHRRTQKFIAGFLLVMLIILLAVLL